MPTDRNAAIERTDHSIPGDPGITLAVREVRPVTASHPTPLLLVHGGGGGGVASFDSPVPGYSLAEDLARMGRIALAIDLRGWGGSTRPAALDAPAADNPPAVSSEEACRDIEAVAGWAMARAGTDQIDLFGWATGGHWTAMWAARNPGRVRKLATLNALAGVDAPWSMHAAFADPDDATQFNRSIGAYGIRDANSLLGAWNRTIPIDDKDAWRDPAVAEAYARDTIASDPTHSQREPHSVRTPTGFQRDSFLQSHGHQFWDPAAITADVMIIRGERDFWSREADVEFMDGALVNSPMVVTVWIPDGTHFLFLDRPERGRAELMAALERFFTISG